jgi:predicted DNA-binding protein with PD1-like motif
MHSSELVTGRTAVIVLEHGEDFLRGLREGCAQQRVRQGIVSMFIAGLRDVQITGRCDKPEDEDPEGPVWTTVYLPVTDALGCGTLATDAGGGLSPHIHVSAGRVDAAADGYTSHLLSARVQFTAEIVVTEVLSPVMTREPSADLYDVDLLRLGDRRRGVAHLADM